MYLIILKTALAGRVNNSKQIMEKLSSKGFFVLKSIVGKMDAGGDGDGDRKGGGGLLGRYSFDAVVTCSL